MANKTQTANLKVYYQTVLTVTATIFSGQERGLSFFYHLTIEDDGSDHQNRLVPGNILSSLVWVLFTILVDQTSVISPVSYAMFSCPKLFWKPPLCVEFYMVGTPELRNEHETLTLFRCVLY